MCDGKTTYRALGAYSREEMERVRREGSEAYRRKWHGLAREFVRTIMENRDESDRT